MSENPEDLNVTAAALAHAKEVGVDITSIQGTGKDGTITKADVAAAVAKVPTGDWYYSLDPKHEATDLLDDRRFFQYSGDGCPEENGKQVSAVPVPAKGVFPSSILEVAARLSQK